MRAASNRFFGVIRSGEVELNPIGKIAEEIWISLPDHFPHVALDSFIIMPTHMHGIVFIVEEDATVSNRHVRAQLAAPIHDRGPRVAPGSPGAIVRSYKSAVTKAVNELHNNPGQSVWRRNYYERVIRNEKELDEIRHYIQNNALKGA